jgi:uncharacterized repeat protein (TIGR03803 family)
VRGPTSETQALTSRLINLQTGDVPAQTQHTVLYSFAGGSSGDASGPTTTLTNVNGVLYGTTSSGGASFLGTVFKITTSGAESVLHSFHGNGDGAVPQGGLTNLDGVLYGTTEYGGADNYGTVFKITTSGKLTILHSFHGVSFGGANPGAGLTAVDGVLYGTTPASGGTVYKITTAGEVTVLHRFAGASDGADPQAGLTNVDGVLYGTTTGGGANGAGTVFKITTSGAESVLHSFGSGNDGQQPRDAVLANVNGVLYGTTPYGGAIHNIPRAFANGTIFKITTSGTENVLHSFGGGPDGRYPTAGLTNVNGVLYGTTIDGGSGYNTGTVFKMTTSGLKTTVYRFTGGSDGAGPYGGLTYLNNALYGTTFGDGANDEGTVFSLSL